MRKEFGWEVKMETKSHYLSVQQEATCPYLEKCSDILTGKCKNCSHNKRSYFHRKDVEPFNQFYPPPDYLYWPSPTADDLHYPYNQEYYYPYVWTFLDGSNTFTIDDAPLSGSVRWAK